MTFRSILLASATLFLPLSVSAQPQPPVATDQPSSTTAPNAAPTAEPIDESADEEEIVITGQRAPGSVVGDIPAQNTLDSRDVRATGATNINELLDALAPQIGSSQGRGGERPVLLLNGQRISSFRELRDIPTEAISRVEILPEEVALKYGYRADQKVVNIVLRQRFRSTAAQVGATAATQGGYGAANGDLTRLMIGKNGRTTFNLHAEGNSILTENERDILLDSTTPGATAADELAARSLVGSRRDIRGSATFNRKILGDVSATLNTELEHTEGKSLIGLGQDLLVLDRNTHSDSAHAGIALNGEKARWHWSVTGNADIEKDVTGTDRDDPAFPHDRAEETTTSGDLSATANGNLFKLPAGLATTTLKVGGSTVHLDGQRRRLGVTTDNSLGRTIGTASANVDLPISRRNRDFSALGNLTLNANAEVDQLSDFGTLTTLGAGANWSPVDRLNLLTSWTREEGPPTINQLGDPILETPGTRIFDFTTGQTVFVNAITGGNPELQSDRRSVLKFGGNWQPFPKTDLRLRAEYVHSTIDNPIQNIFGPTPALEAAFPGRFVRDPSGQLVSVDLRPVNFDQARRDTLRVGFDFTKPLKSRRPSQSVMDQIRAQFGRSRGGAAAGQNPTAGGAAAGQNPTSGGAAAGQNPTADSAPAAPPPEGGPPPGAGPPSEGGPGGGGFGGFGGRGGGGGGGFFGGGSRGRLTFSLTDTITFVDQVSIGPGLPELDYLHGEAAGANGGTPRHNVEAQAGWSNNGLGARIGANWRSATRVDGLNGDDLRFSSLATFDLRLFANPGDIPEIALKHPWLRGTQVRLEATNLFDAKPNVRDPAGKVPLNYQPDLLNPLGRTVMISFRKLFTPPPSFFRRQREQEQQQASPTR
jgi:hypothetical protein